MSGKKNPTMTCEGPKNERINIRSKKGYNGSKSGKCCVKEG